MEGMKRDARRDWQGKGWLALTAFLALAISLFSCASMQTPRDEQPGAPSAISDSQTRVISEGTSEGPRAVEQQEKEDARGQRGSVSVKDVIGALVVTVLSPATWSAIFQAIAGRGFWP